MADTETIRRQVQSQAPFSTWLGVLFLFVLFGAIVLAVIGPSPRGTNYEQARAEKRIEKFKTLMETTTKQLSTYGWIDKGKGSVHIPIQRAMELTVAELSAKKPAPAYPIATPALEAAAGGAASASPAPAPSAQPRTSPKATSTGGPRSEAGGQSAAAIKPAGAQAGTQPGPSATPAASPQSSAAAAPSSPSPIPSPTAGGSPLPVRGKTPSQ